MRPSSPQTIVRLNSIKSSMKKERRKDNIINQNKDDLNLVPSNIKKSPQIQAAGWSEREQIK